MTADESKPQIMTLRLDADVRTGLELVAAVDRRSMTQAANVLLWEALAARAILGSAPAKLVQLVEEHNRTLGIEE